jgi:hypothetical protein
LRRFALGLRLSEQFVSKNCKVCSVNSCLPVLMIWLFKAFHKRK